MAINNVVLLGRLTANPELRTTATGVTLSRFCLAVERAYTSGGEKKADFINCVAWKNQAEFVERYFRKGDMIALTGAIQTHKYTDSSGQSRMSFEVAVERVSFAGGKKEAVAKSETTTEGDVSVDDFEEIPDEDLPF